MRDMSQILERWAAWARSENSGVDYSHIAAVFKGLLPQSSGTSLMCSDDVGLVIESCLAKLKNKNPNEHSIVVAHYLYRISKHSIAKK